jgi:peptidoglycan hydrolase CwlO-like protein
MDEVTIETKLQLINQERQMWLSAREVMTIRYRVNKRLANTDGLKAVEKELENCEAALDELDKIISEMTAKIPENAEKNRKVK